MEICYEGFGLNASLSAVWTGSRHFGCLFSEKKVRRGSATAISGFVMYVVIMLFITFLSREDGSRIGIDLQLLSTWGINQRNNAFVIENILLFIPYGFLCACVFKCARKMIPCVFIGMLTSFAIEWIQLITQRGYFQIDDILTNTLGALFGFLLYRLLKCIKP